MSSVPKLTATAIVNTAFLHARSAEAAEPLRQRIRQQLLGNEAAAVIALLEQGNEAGVAPLIAALDGAMEADPQFKQEMQQLTLASMSATPLPDQP
jgi:hypothetical protein